LRRKRAGEPRAVEARDRLLGTLARKHPPEHLTARQDEVVYLAGAWAVGGEIAAELGVSVETVRTHMKEARRRLGARTSAHVVALWLASQRSS
jgi:DNA-binding CsgD family transcriptional regulator